MKDSEETLTEAEIDRIVISHAEDDSAWEEPVLVKRSRAAGPSIRGASCERPSSTSCRRLVENP